MRWASIASRLPGRTGEIKKLLELSFKEALQPNSASEPTDTKPKTLPTTHIAEWQNVRVEADARMSITLILLSLSTGAGDCDYFLLRGILKLFKLSEPWATWESVTMSKERPNVASFQAGGNKAAMEKRASGNGLAGVEVLEKSKKDLEQARKKDKVLFEEAIGKERKLSEENHETFKEEMIKDTNEKLSSRC
ncbi:hypothetical protein Tco_0921183 [Tanacetum coccineum]